MQPYPPIVAQAIQALGIKQPIYRYEVKGNTVTFWLYARTEPVKWRKPRKRKPRAKKK